MLKDDELKGSGNSYDFGARIYDPRLGRWLACDQLFGKYPMLSPYQFVDNNPILLIDPDGRIITIPVEGGDPIVYTPNMKSEGYTGNTKKAIEALNTLYANSSDVFKPKLDKLTASDVKYNLDINDNHKLQDGSDMDGGETVYNFEKNQVEIKIDPSAYPDEFYAMLGDELTTAEQFEEGEIGYYETTEGVGVSGYDMNDEYETKVGAVEATKAAHKGGIANAKTDKFSERLYNISKDGSLEEKDKNKAIKKEFKNSQWYNDLSDKKIPGSEIEGFGGMKQQKSSGVINKGVYRENGKTEKIE
jgi:RHS repeat-associated protein